MAADKQRRKAKNIVLDSDFQLRAWMHSSALALIGISTLVFFYVYMNYEFFTEINAIVGSHPQVATVYESFKVTSIVLVGLLVSIAVLNFFFSLRFSHRVVGPIYRMKTYIEDVLSGDKPGRLTLRDGDNFVELAELIDKLSRRVDLEKHESDESAS